MGVRHPLYKNTDIPATLVKGQYSIALLRKIIGGKVVEIPLGQTIALQNGTAALIHKVFQFADLNGDGVMEIIAGNYNHDGYSYQVHEIKNGKASLVINYDYVEHEASSTSGVLTYNRKPISPLLDSPISEVIKVLGEPLGKAYQHMDENGDPVGNDTPYRFDYDGIHLWFGEAGKFIKAESYFKDVGKLAIDGVTLNKNRAELIKALGAPEQEGREEGMYGDEDAFIMRYRMSNGVVFLEFGKDLNVPPGGIYFYRE